MTPDAQVFDHVRRLFGVGDWDDDGNVAFWEWRMTEIAKVKRKRVKARVSAEELCTAADYCKAHGIDIRNVAWLYQHLGDAKRWGQARQRALAASAIDELLAEAIDVESSVPESPWLEQLIRARGPHREEIYHLWKQRSSQPSDGTGAA